MRWWIGILMASVFFVGCSYKSSPLSFAPYYPTRAPIVAGKSIAKVYLKSVEDVRERNSIVAVATSSNGEMIGAVTTAEPVNIWLYNAIKKGLESRGIEVVDTPVKEAKRVDIYLREFFATYNGEILEGKNMKGVMDVRVKVRYEGKTITKNISQRQSTWHALITDSEDFQPFLQTLLNDIAARSVENIVSIK